MATSFSAVETAVNAAACAALANATLTWGALTADGVLDRSYADPLGLVSRSTRFVTLAAALPSIAQGASVSVAGIAYTVRNVEPDGSGVVSLLLEAV